MVTQLYRNFIPENLRNQIYELFLGDILRFKRNFRQIIKMKFHFVFRKFLPDTEKNRCYAFMGKYGLCGTPYPFLLEYKTLAVKCTFDQEKGMFFVNHYGKRLYFKRSESNPEDVISHYQRLLAEQDARSPHQYIPEITRLSGKTLLDIGAAEAIFSLDAIDSVSKVYLFECDNDWVEALEATFEPWKDKVEIVQKYVSNINNETNITIDNFLESKDLKNLFIKMDIEGYEMDALEGAKQTFANGEDLDFSIAIYHKETDEQDIKAFLKQYNFDFEQTTGYFYCQLDKNNNGLRRAIIRKTA
jgi:hypothetical protein